jgi:hypothetical protein
MAVEEADLHDREVWSSIARMWYNKATVKFLGLDQFQQYFACISVGYSSGQLFGDDESTKLL